jgi:DeoR family transcriptional regulator of aga operon
MESGAACYSSDQVYVNSALVRHSRRTIVAVDYTKFGINVGWSIFPISEIDKLVTDSGAIEEVLSAYERAPLQIIRT